MKLEITICEGHDRCHAAPPRVFGTNNDRGCHETVRHPAPETA